jgi:uncharacterized protein (DUF2147 family)
MKKLFGVVVAAAMLGAPVAHADSVAGTWLTGPDKKGQVAHIVVKPCGSAFCGQVDKTFDKTGKLIKGPNDGKRVLWDMKAAKVGNYEGKLLLPLYGKTIRGKLSVKGKRLTVKGCMGPICQSQKWTKLK